MSSAIPLYEAQETARRPTRQADIDAYGGAMRGAEGMRWLSSYADGDPVKKDDVVRRMGGVYVANKDTSEIPNVRFLGDPIGIFDDQIVWTPQSQAGYVATGNQITFNRHVELDAVRLYINDISGLTDYHWAVLDKNDVVLLYQKIEIPGSTGFLELPVNDFIVKNGESFRIMLQAENYESPQTPWTYDWTSTLTPAPSSGQFYHDAASGLLQIAKNDNGATDRSTDLLAMVIGSTIYISENASRFVDYRMTVNPVDMGVYYEWLNCELLDIGSNIRNDRVCAIEGISPAGGNSEYMENLDYWSNNVSADFNAVGLFMGSVTGPIVTNNNAYGVDLKYIPLEVPNDWDIIV